MPLDPSIIPDDAIPDAQPFCAGINPAEPDDPETALVACSDCNGEFDPDDLEEHCDNLVCSSCAEAYGHCDDCNREYPRDVLTSCGGDDDWIDLCRTDPEGCADLMLEALDKLQRYTTM